MALSDDPEVRRRQLAAIYASGGFGFGGHGRHKPRLGFSGGIKNFAGGVSTGAVVGATSTVFPQAATVYSIYKGAKIVKDLYDRYSDSPKNRNREILDKICSETAGYGAEKISENVSSGISSEVRSSAENSGIINAMAISIGVSSTVLGNILEKSINDGLIEGAGNFTSYAIEGIMSW